MRRGGSVLIITLWIITILAVLAVTIGRYISLEIRLLKHRAARQEARALARSGVYLAMERLKHDATPYDAPGDIWAQPPGAGASDDPALWVVPGQEALEPSVPARFIEIRITDEERKLNLNRPMTGPDDPWFDTLSRLVGIAAAGRIVDYVDADSDGFLGSGPEQDASGPAAYLPKNGALVALEELRGIPEVTDEAVATLERLGSVHYTESGKLNINTVEQEILEAMRFENAQTIATCWEAKGKIFEEEADLIAKAEECIGGQVGPVEQGWLQQANVGTASNRFTVRSRGVVALAPSGGSPSSDVRADVQAVVQRQGCQPSGTPSPCIVAWREL